MQEFHNQTNISLKKFYSEPTFIDYRTQPRDHKIYPKFLQRLSLDDIEALQFIKNIGKVTYTKRYGNDQVNLRVNPSAGGLYPCEVYIQIRGVKGVISGLYHYEPLHDTLVLLHEIEQEAVEAYYENNAHQHQFVFLVSVAYFRSAWKYENRSLRYLLLDVGHQLACIYTALRLSHKEMNLDFNFDQEALNSLLCFEGFEFFLASITSGRYKEKSSTKIKQKIAHVSACDYQIRDEYIESFAQQSLKHFPDNLDFFDFFKETNMQDLQTAVNKRRSVRAFKKESITKKEFEVISQDVFALAQSWGIEIFYINNNIESLKKGVYKNVTLLKEGDFKEKATSLALNQKLAGNSGVTLFYTASQQTNYIQSSIFSGFLAHIISLKATLLNIDSSGIGAYFDEECQKFLQTNNNILYLQVVGR